MVEILQRYILYITYPCNSHGSFPVKGEKRNHPRGGYPPRDRNNPAVTVFVYLLIKSTPHHLVWPSYLFQCFQHSCRSKWQLIQSCTGRIINCVCYNCSYANDCRFSAAFGWLIHPVKNNTVNFWKP